MRVKIKKKTKPGDQVDYSLAEGSMYEYSTDNYTPSSPDVKTTLKKVDRSKANIEAEGGESIVGDFNEDGLLEHSKVSGNRHSQGGVPLNVPDGSFVFSDTRKLKIKDKDTLEYFDVKRPSTPSKIAKKYDLNNYNQILLDPDSDKITKETAARMIENNKRKLSEVAMVQEAMKGFPEGVPSFVENGTPQMKKGGTTFNIPFFQEGGKSEWVDNPWDIRNYGKMGRGLYREFYEEPKKTLKSLGEFGEKIGTLEDYLLQGVRDIGYNLFLNPDPDSIQTPVEKNIPTKVEELNNYPNSKVISSDTVKVKVKTKSFMKNGGELPQYQNAGKVIIEEAEDGSTKTILADGTVVIKDPNGKVVSKASNASSVAPISLFTPPNNPGTNRTVVTDNSNTIIQRPSYKQSPLEDLLKEKADDFIFTNTKVDNLSTQSRRADGTFGPSADFQFDFDDFKARHGDFLKSLGFEPDEFIDDLKNPATTQKMTKFFQDEYNKEFEKRYGELYFKPRDTEPYGNDGQFGVITYSAPGFKVKQNLVPDAVVPTPPAVVAPPSEKPPGEKEDVVPLPGFASDAKPVNDGWWLQDIAAFTGTMLDRVNEYRPKRQQVTLDRTESTLLDPTRQIAAIQEQSARYQDLAMNTSEGQVARANVLANSGQALGATADIIGNYENQNAQIVNQTNATNTGIANQETMTNVELDDRYITQLATMKQQKDNAMRELKNRRLAAFVNGTTNNMKKKLMDQVLFPNYAINPLTFDMQFQGAQGRTAIGYDPYVNPQMGAAGVNDPMEIVKKQSEQAIQAKNELIKSGMKEEDAKWALQQFGRNIRPNERGANNLFDLQSMYNQMF